MCPAAGQGALAIETRDDAGAAWNEGVASLFRAHGAFRGAGSFAGYARTRVSRDISLHVLRPTTRTRRCARPLPLEGAAGTPDVPRPLVPSHRHHLGSR